MDITIYQINMGRDHNRIAFEGLDLLKMYQGSDKIDSRIYDRVFEGEVDCKDLEDVYRKFNLEHPEGYKGRSLSVSDVVEIVDENGDSTFHFCDSIGFKQIDFDPYLTEEFKEDKIKVVLCEPGKVARVAEISNTLADLQKTVKGDIEQFCPYEEAVAIICNEEGKFNGMMPNRAIYSEPQEVEMSYSELTSRFREAERNGGEHLTGYIVFTEDSFTTPYPEAARTYAVSSNNKAFQPNMGGYSIYGSALDGSDPMIRLEGYMQSERGGKDGWKIERCYMKSDEKEMIDVIFGPFFICDCSGANYGSLNQEQIDRFMKQFENPERLIRMNGMLVYGNRFYLIGEGHKEFLADKTRDSDYYVLTLAAIARELNIKKLTSGRIRIAAGLPLTWVSGQRDDFKNYLLQNRSVEFSFRNTNYSIEVVGVDVFPQGFAAVADRLSDFKGVNMLCDIGNGTMNIMFINDKKPVPGNMFTEKFGTHQCLLAARENVMRVHHTTVDDAIINRVFRFGIADINEKYLKTITDTATEYVEGIFQRLREHEYNPELMRLYVLGGGSCLIRNFGTFDKERVTINDDICATAKGYEYLSELNVRRSGQP